jgi:hypothetical protein
MHNINIEQVIHLSDLLQDTANDFAAYLISNNENLRSTERDQLITDNEHLREVAENLLDYASLLVFDNIYIQLEQLDLINITIREKLQGLAEIQKVILISASFLLLAESIISTNPKEIIKNISQLYKDLNINTAPEDL